MKKNFKKIAAAAMAMALTAATMVPVVAEEKAVYQGTVNDEDLQVNMTLPTDGNLTLKPYAKNQISSDPGMYFQNQNKASDTDKVGYIVNLAGYTCVATPKNTADKAAIISVATTKPTSGTAKVITVSLQLGVVESNATSASAITTDAATFNSEFTAPTATLAVEKLSTASYDGKNVTDYTKASEVTGAVVKPEEVVPFRITGTMNEKATWTAGDKVVVVPVFSVEVSTGAV